MFSPDNSDIEKCLLLIYHYLQLNGIQSLSPTSYLNVKQLKDIHSILSRKPIAAYVLNTRCSCKGKLCSQPATAISHRGGKVVPQLAVIIYRCLLIPTELQKPKFSDKNGGKNISLQDCSVIPSKLSDVKMGDKAGIGG